MQLLFAFITLFCDDKSEVNGEMGRKPINLLKWLENGVIMLITNQWLGSDLDKSAHRHISVTILRSLNIYYCTNGTYVAHANFSQFDS